ncbi:hypothetical protein NM208_g5803 [Fusarium decemcellulare]|uniref:Uncharacterized protein n=1 Tax=Fusarium decemcellulare TaxID=57161 RepID=A0ACC1SFH5_9HYPO|nr:hypothetical protein NM208_g5803 [Fusarium decemcellulare]
MFMQVLARIFGVPRLEQESGGCEQNVSARGIDPAKLRNMLLDTFGSSYEITVSNFTRMSLLHSSAGAAFARANITMQVNRHITQEQVKLGKWTMLVVGGGKSTLCQVVITNMKIRWDAAMGITAPEYKKRRAMGKSLSNRILDSFESSEFDSKPAQFLTESKIRTLLKDNHVVRAMWGGKAKLTPRDTDLINFILQKAKKLFMIAVHITCTRKQLLLAMKLFEAKGFSDANLPVDTYVSRGSTSGNDEEASDEDTSDDEEVSFEAIFGDSSPIDSDEIGNIHDLTKLDPKEKLWTPTMISRFSENQWKFLAPVLSTANPNYDLHLWSILPFTSKEDSHKHGAFSRVFKVKIHEDHYQDPEREEDPPAEHFAIKEIRPTTEEDRRNVERNWESEAEALQQMNRLKQKHIVRFITAFKRGNEGSKEHYLMFEWADGGSLRDIWMDQDNKPTRGASLVREAVEQLLGISEALCAAHDLDGRGSSFRHGDLKPENILSFRNGNPNTIFGTLKIGDWGLAKHHNLATQLRTKQTSTRHGTLRYEPPEVAIGLSQQGGHKLRLSRLYDMWSMGCVMLELIIWLRYGEDELLRFNLSVKGKSIHDGPCYQIENDGNSQKAKVHPVVIQWMDHLAKDSACGPDTALGELLKVVRDKLLVVQLPPQMGNFYMNEPNDQSDGPLIHISPPTSNIVPPLPSNRISEAQADEVTPAFDYENTNSSHREPEPAQGPCRALAATLRQELKNIAGKKREATYYWPSVIDSSRLGPRDSTSEEMLGVPKEKMPKEKMPTINKQTRGDTATSQQFSTNVSKIIGMAIRRDSNLPKLDNHWEVLVDNHFANEVLSSMAEITETQPLHRARQPERLCDSCRNIDFWALGFAVMYDIPELKRKSQVCELCGLFWRTCQKEEGAHFPTVRFDRIMSSLRMNGSGGPVLTLCRSPKLKTRTEVQIGIPELPQAGSRAHSEIIKRWLRLCDEKHPGCQVEAINDQGGETRLPTRLINVGKEGDQSVRLCETDHGDSGQYIALSHLWGSGPHFCTNRGNMNDHRRGIDINALPATFRDAVTVTRSLGLQYLWIDSICIIQGPDGDFNTEAKRMETVFSSAYCVIASNRGTGHNSGFLQSRRQREFVTLRRENGETIYVCENIDNFEHHVLEGDLSRRGWVLQEHALARRTVFFTDEQMYWECGKGVRCETLTSMRNNRAAFLGDPNFPQVFFSGTRGEKIRRYQHLYERYSQLEFTHAYDRPIALVGLETRLLRAFGTKGGFGVFDEGRPGGLLRRSLLWYRHPKQPALVRILPGPNRSMIVPSWSWMGYTGGIVYLQLEFNRIDWKDITSPWTPNVSRTARTTDRGADIALSAVARRINPEMSIGAEDKLFFDMPGGSEKRSIYGIVLGVRRAEKVLDNSEPGIHYLLLVAPTGRHDLEGNEIWERVGAGSLPGKCVAPSGTPVKIH